MQRFTDKRILITGGTSGIGLESARQFIAEGGRVAITGSRPETVDKALSQLSDHVLGLVSNSADVNAQRDLATRIQSEFGGLDVLVVNAGVAELHPFENWSEEAYDRVFAINLKGPFFLIQSLLPLFANPSSIVFTASVNAHIGMPTTSVYGATKAGLLSLARTLSGELIARGIRINAVSPGPIATPLHDKFGLSDAASAAMKEALSSQIPVKRFGTPAEVAKAIVYFASDDSAFTVGSELIIDGGMTTL